MMKRIGRSVLPLASVLLLAACGDKAPEPKAVAVPAPPAAPAPAAKAASAPAPPIRLFGKAEGA